MRLRTRLSLAFFLVSVLPLAVVTAYSYYSSGAALRRAAETQADQMAADMGNRMSWVMADLGDRVERLWRMRVEQPSGGSAPGRAGATDAAGVTRRVAADPATDPTAAAAVPDAEAAAAMRNVATMMLAEAAPLVQRLEFSSKGVDEVSVPPSGPPPGPVPDPGAERSGRGGRSGMRGDGRGRRTADGSSPMLPPPEGFGPGGPRPRPPMPPGQRTGAAPRTAVRGVPVVAPGMPRIVIEFAEGAGEAGTEPARVFEALDPSELTAWRVALQRQADREAQLRLRSDVEISAATIQAATDTAERAAAQGRGAARAVPQADQERRRQARQAHMTALARGESLKFAVERNGEVIGEINASVDQRRLIETVLSLARRDRGEIPFVLAPSGSVHTVDEAADKTIKALNLDFTSLASRQASSTETVGDWLVVTRRDASGIVFGLARPMRDSLRDMRRVLLSNLAVGLLLIAAAFVVMVPLASRLTRHVKSLTDGVHRLARGERGTRVPVESRDEIGDLATAFNAMAAELESHEQMLVRQERLRRELELSRQIQNEMLPHGLLKVGLTEVAGVSVPAREVGGDFFNYFALQDGTIALLVGDVSGKGVGAALLMANVQATLRARLPLDGDLPHLVAQLDLEVAANTPSEVYLTLFVGILDPARRTLRYVNAGHNPQFLLRLAGRIERMGASGFPVGLMPGYPYEERTIEVGAGELLFLYTDGTVEVFNEAGDMFDADRLEAALVRASTGTVNEVLATVEAAILEFRGTAEPYDDATMLALRIAAP